MFRTMKTFRLHMFKEHNEVVDEDEVEMDVDSIGIVNDHRNEQRQQEQRQQQQRQQQQAAAAEPVMADAYVRRGRGASRSNPDVVVLDEVSTFGSLGLSGMVLSGAERDLLMQVLENSRASGEAMVVPAPSSSSSSSSRRR